MPTNKYTYGETYFFIATSEMIDTIIPEPIRDKLGYENEIALKDAAQIVRELADGSFVASVQLSPNPLLPNKCVRDFISEQDFNEALQYYTNYGITEFLTVNEFKELEFKQIEI